jgi:TonB family protein
MTKLHRQFSNNNISLAPATPCSTEFPGILAGGATQKHPPSFVFCEFHGAKADARGEWIFFCAGLGLQAFALLCLLSIPLLFPQKLEPIHRDLVTVLTFPHLTHPPNLRRIVLPIFVRKHTLPIEPLQQPLKPTYLPILASRPALPVKQHSISVNLDAPLAGNNDVSPSSVLPGSMPVPALKKPPEPVQTGLFEAREGPSRPGSRGPNQAGDAMNVVFASSSGPGSRSGNNTRGVVIEGSFVSERAGPPEPSERNTIASNPPKVAVEILEKPRPLYTQEARDKKIEGEVILQIVFSATGVVNVERIISGLGYGLENSAENAARQIRFRPATIAGMPVDSTAVIHMNFQLAY